MSNGKPLHAQEQVMRKITRSTKGADQSHSKSEQVAPARETVSQRRQECLDPNPLLAFTGERSPNTTLHTKMRDAKQLMNVLFGHERNPLAIPLKAGPPTGGCGDLNELRHQNETHNPAAKGSRTVQ